MYINLLTVPAVTPVTFPNGEICTTPFQFGVIARLAIVTFDEILMIVPSTCVFGSVTLAPKLTIAPVGCSNTRFTPTLAVTATFAVGLNC